MARYELGLYDYWRILRRREKIILVTILFSIFFTLISSFFRKRIYSAVARLRVERQTTVASLLTDWVSYYPGDIIATEIQIASSRETIEGALYRLGKITPTMTEDEKERIISIARSKISVLRGEGNIIEIRATSEDPKEAQLLANTVSEVYVERSSQIRTQNRRHLREAIMSQLLQVKKDLEQAEENYNKFRITGDVKGLRDSIVSRIESLRLELQRLYRQYTAQHPQVVALQDEIRYLEESLKSLEKEDLILTRLAREVRIQEDLYNLLNRRAKEALIAESERMDTAAIIDRASLPIMPVAPKYGINILFAIGIGSVLGSIFAIIAENLDTSIARIEEVEEYLQLPVLGVIPTITEEHLVEEEKSKSTEERDVEGKIIRKLMIYHKPTAPVAEAYRTLEINIRVALSEKTKPLTLLFTSTGLQEGKSVTAANYVLAAAQAGQGEKILLVEADLRRPIIHKIFGIESTPGLTEVIIGRYKWKEVVRKTTDILLGALSRDKLLQTPGIENISIIPSGILPRNPIELLRSHRMRAFIAEVKQEYDIVVFDCAPVLPVGDVLVLGSEVDGVVLVYRVGRTARGAVYRAKAQLSSAGSKVLGVVLNDIRASELEVADYYHYYYKYYYGTESPEKKYGSFSSKLLIPVLTIYDSIRNLISKPTGKRKH
jgi:capsular exopolysaccharide synthesis family protein